MSVRSGETAAFTSNHRIREDQMEPNRSDATENTNTFGLSPGQQHACAAVHCGQRSGRCCGRPVAGVTAVKGSVHFTRRDTDFRFVIGRQPSGSRSPETTTAGGFSSSLETGRGSTDSACVRAWRRGHRDELLSLLTQSSWLLVSPLGAAPQMRLFFLR